MYQRGKLTFNEEKPGEGTIKWIDSHNVIFEREWWHVLSVYQKSGRVEIGRWWWDGTTAHLAKRLLAPLQARLTFRPIGKTL